MSSDHARRLRRLETLARPNPRPHRIPDPALVGMPEQQAWMDTLTVPELRTLAKVLDHQERGTPVDTETLERGMAILETWTHGEAG